MVLLYYIKTKDRIERAYMNKPVKLHILMNPPYDGDLHLQILNKVSKVFPNAIISNISPVAPLYEHFAYGRNLNLDSVESYHIKNIISEQKAEKDFGLSNIGSDLGIWVRDPAASNNTNICSELFGTKYDLISKMWAAVEPTEKLVKHIIKFNACSKPLVLKLVYGLSLNNHGLRTPSSFNLISLNYNTAIAGIDSIHTRYLEFDNEKDRRLYYDLYTSTIMRFFYKEVLRGRCDYNLIPWFDTTTLEQTAIENFLINFFKLSVDDLKTINNDMKDFLSTKRSPKYEG